MALDDRRSPLAQAIGLGSAKSGVKHWWAERASAVALIPLTLWFVSSLIAHSASDHAAFTAWVRQPYVTIVLIGLLITLFYHMALGLRVIVEDYVHSSLKYVVVLLFYLGCAALAIAGIVAAMRIAFGS